MSKLRYGARLTAEDEAVIAVLTASVSHADRGDVLIEGAATRTIPLVLEGWACRYKLLENGKRQITNVFLPGDLCEPFGILPRRIDYTFAALTPVVLAHVPPAALRAAAKANPRVEEALWWDLLVSDAVMREHAVSLGRRSATERLGSFFCELEVRLGMTGHAADGGYNLPLTQTDLAELFGLSAVHVNRSLQELRSSGLITFRQRRVTIHDIPALRELSMFNPGYLTVGAGMGRPAAGVPVDSKDAELR